MKINSIIDLVKDLDTSRQTKNLNKLLIRILLHLQVEFSLHYQNVLFIVFKLLGFYTQAEYHTSEGRIDLVVKTEQYIYVMEFKLDGSAEEALKQINDKQYALPFSTDTRKVYKLGVNFSHRTRSIEKWVTEEVRS